jgi:hypothetical protein
VSCTLRGSDRRHTPDRAADFRVDLHGDEAHRTMRPLPPDPHAIPEPLMSFLADPALQQKFVAALNANEAFVTQATVFDGAIQIEVDGDCLWLKIYKGKVIDHQAAPSIFGYTFKLAGPERAWRLLLNGERMWADLTFPGKRHFEDDPGLTRVGEMTSEIHIEGNLVEAGRLTEATFELAYTLKRVAA